MYNSVLIELGILREEQLCPDSHCYSSGSGQDVLDLRQLHLKDVTSHYITLNTGKRQ